MSTIDVMSVVSRFHVKKYKMAVFACQIFISTTSGVSIKNLRCTFFQSVSVALENMI